YKIVSYQSGFKVKSDLGQFRVAEKIAVNRINLMQLPDSDAFMADISSVWVNKNLFFYRHLYDHLNLIKFNVEMDGLSQVNYTEKQRRIPGSGCFCSGAGTYWRKCVTK
ncbi:MAG: hypothetical protein P0107_08910, partial [Nitrosomonas sp.]|nr:hypothetical protein [Nitrosomonas sp.]